MEKRKQVSISVKSILIVIAVVALIITAIVLIVNKVKDNGIDKNAFTDSEYQSLEVTNIEANYDEATNKTKLSFVLKNPTSKKLENQFIDIILMNDKEQQLAGIQLKIESLESKGEKAITSTLSGDGSQITKAKAQKTPEQLPEETPANEEQQ